MRKGYGMTKFKKAYMVLGKQTNSMSRGGEHLNS